jgi:hypothetical protein
VGWSSRMERNLSESSDSAVDAADVGWSKARFISHLLFILM